MYEVLNSHNLPRYRPRKVKWNDNLCHKLLILPCSFGQLNCYYFVLHCHINLSDVPLMQTSTTAVQSYTNGTLRLINGTVESAGREELCINGVWGTVCNLDNHDAQVVCRQMGYSVNRGKLPHSLGRGSVI